MRFVIAAAVVLLATAQAMAQSAERQFSVTLPESQWNTLGKIVSKSRDFPWEDTNPIMQSILAQIGQGLQSDVQARQSAAKEIERLKAENEQLKAAPKPEPEPEKP